MGEGQTRKTERGFSCLVFTAQTDRNALEVLEAAIQPDVDAGADHGGPTVEGVGYHQEVVRSNREELPVISSGRGQSLVHLEELNRCDEDKEDT